MKITTLTFLATSILFLNGCIVNVDDDDGSLFGCKKGRGNSESRNVVVPNFSAVDLSVDADVYITQGSTQEVRVEGQSNVLDELQFRVFNNELDIDFDDCFRSFDRLEVFITMNSLDGISISGSGDVFGRSGFDSNFLDIDVSGSGSVSLEVLSASKVTTKISGSGDIELEGNTEDQAITISGSGKYRGFDLISDDADVRISGSGFAEVFVSNELSGSISGSGTVFYKGSPTVSISVSGSGKVMERN